VVAVCDYTERLRAAVAEWMALLELPKRHAALHQDPVAQREHRAWLVSAEGEALQLIRALLGQPEAESLHWFWGGKERLVTSRRHLQWQLSDWVEKIAYPQTPLLRNELINRDHPSASANTGRKRLLAAMLSAPGEESLGIAKTPAEKSLYLSLLQESGLHRRQNGRLGFYPPDQGNDPCNVNPVWEAMTQLLGDHGERQIALPELYATLTGRPFGLKLGVLLFDALPQALGLNPADLTTAPGEVIEGFIQHEACESTLYLTLQLQWSGSRARKCPPFPL